MKKEKKGFINENSLELLVAIFLGITALLIAWATWVGSLHGGNQSTNYTKSNNLSAEGNSEYNEGLQLYMSDLMAYNTVVSLQFDIEIANLNGRKAEAQLLEAKLESFEKENCSDQLQEAIEWAVNQEGDVSPFDKKGFVDSYFESANDKLQESEDLLKEGQKDNSNGDKYGLVTVIYSVALFLLGIITIFKNFPNRKAVFIISAISIILATIYMITIPLPTDFNLLNFFKK